MMTIKEFARLCACNAQTLRYYDKIDLLKPVKVDPWSGYRYYDASQAVAFVKIKNLQAADFSIEEIRSLLAKTDQQVYDAFEEKIRQQAAKLQRIREIQKSYLTEKNMMEKVIHGMVDFLLSQSCNWQLLEEFGLTKPQWLEAEAALRQHLEGAVTQAPDGVEMNMTVNEELVSGNEAVLSRIQALTQKDLGGTILLSDCEEPEFQVLDPKQWECIWKCDNWEHVRDFLQDIPALKQDREYCLWLQFREPKAGQDLSVAMFMLGAVLRLQKLQGVRLSCIAEESADGVNHFKLMFSEPTPGRALVVAP